MGVFSKASFRAYWSSLIRSPHQPERESRLAPRYLGSEQSEGSQRTQRSLGARSGCAMVQSLVAPAPVCLRQRDKACPCQVHNREGTLDEPSQPTRKPLGVPTPERS